MVNLRSLVLVEEELTKVGLRPVDIGMGEADVLGDISIVQQVQLRIALRQSGLDLLENKVEILVHRIRLTIFGVVYGDQLPAKTLSGYLSDTLGYDYTYMSNVFSDRTTTTIEGFYICHRVERVKQLLLYEGLTLTEIAQRMRFSSISHLSGQFKMITGKTPSQFKSENRGKHPAPGHCG